MAGVFDFGDALISQRRWQADQERLAQRDAWEREDRAYRDSERKRVADARFSLENTISGMSGGSQAEIAASGYTPEQIATGMQARGGARQFAEQVAKYQGDYDSSDLQSGGAGERVAAGLPLQGARVDPSTVKAPRKSELAGARAKYALAMGQDPGAALADQDAALTQERMKDWFSQFEKLSNEKLLEHPALAAMLNGNAAVRGAVGLRSDGKTYTISDYNGSGRSEDFTRDELMQAAYQRFLESEGRIPESIALGIGRTDRKRTRNREDVRDTNEGQKLAFDMNLGNAKFGLAQEELRDNRNFRNQSLGLQREGLSLQSKQYEDSRWKPLGATTDGRGLAMVSLDGRFKTVAAPEGVDTRTYFPKQVGKLRLEDNGVYHNERGLPVGKADERYGIVPLQPAPVPSREAAKKLAMHNVQPVVVSADESGTPAWAWVVPNNSGEGVVTYDNPEEAAMAIATPATPAQVKRAVNRQGDPMHRLGTPAEPRMRPSQPGGRGFGLRPPGQY